MYGCSLIILLRLLWWKMSLTDAAHLEAGCRLSCKKYGRAIRRYYSCNGGGDCELPVRSSYTDVSSLHGHFGG